MPTGQTNRFRPPSYGTVVYQPVMSATSWTVPLEWLWISILLEGRLIWLALRALRIGVNVVLDFGGWGKDERSALRALAASVGAACQLIYLQVDEEEQGRRVQARSQTDAATTFEMTQADLERWRHIFQPPEGSELETAKIDPPPTGFDSWTAWAAQWWPTSLPGYDPRTGT